MKKIKMEYIHKKTLFTTNRITVEKYARKNNTKKKKNNNNNEKRNERKYPSQVNPYY